LAIDQTLLFRAFDQPAHGASRIEDKTDFDARLFSGISVLAKSGCEQGDE